jgi:hypothetical protein
MVAMETRKVGKVGPFFEVKKIKNCPGVRGWETPDPLVGIGQLNASVKEFFI